MTDIIGKMFLGALFVTGVLLALLAFILLGEVAWVWLGSLPEGEWRLVAIGFVVFLVLSYVVGSELWDS